MSFYSHQEGAGGVHWLSLAEGAGDQCGRVRPHTSLISMHIFGPLFLYCLGLNHCKVGWHPLIRARRSKESGHAIAPKYPGGFAQCDPRILGSWPSVLSSKKRAKTAKPRRTASILSHCWLHSRWIPIEIISLPSSPSLHRARTASVSAGTRLEAKPRQEVRHGSLHSLLSWLTIFGASRLVLLPARVRGPLSSPYN